MTWLFALIKGLRLTHLAVNHAVEPRMELAALVLPLASRLPAHRLGRKQTQ